MCSILELLACFSLGGLYIDGAVVASNQPEYGIEIQTRTEQVIVSTRHGKIPGIAQINEPVLVDVSGNPYARAAIGYDVQWSKRWATRFEVSHESSISTGRDRGAERVTLGVTWRPFAK